MNLLSGAADTSDQMQEDWFDFPINPLDEVVPGLWQASSELEPPELFAQGFDAIFDLGDRPRGHSVPGRAYVYYRIEDLPLIEDPSAIELVRCARGPHALCNERFATWLGLAAEGSREGERLTGH